MINREEVLKALTELRNDRAKTVRDMELVNAMIAIVNFAPEEGEAKEGHWKAKGKQFVCSECGSKEKAEREYCPHCGAHMVGDFE